MNIVDNASIYILIAGTSTPFTLIVLNGWIGWTIFGISWGLAIIGVLLRLFYTSKNDTISTAAYVLMVWHIIFAIKPLINGLSFEGLMWLFVGGIPYTIEAVLYSVRTIKFKHAIFQIFVLCGSFCHFMAVFFHVLPIKI